MHNTIFLKKDFVIPKGTVFELMKGDATFYKDTNYQAYIHVNKDNCGRFIISTDITEENFDTLKEIDSNEEEKNK